MTGTLVRRTSRFVYLCDAKDADLPIARFGWRLVAANNRPLGRGLRVEGSLAQCRAAAQRLHDDVAEISAVVHFDPARGLWSWRVALGETTVAVCAHPYLRRVECGRALAQFLTVARSTSPAAGPVRCFGPRSLRAYEDPLVPAEESSSPSDVASAPPVSSTV